MEDSEVQRNSGNSGVESNDSKSCVETIDFDFRVQRNCGHLELGEEMSAIPE